VVALANGERIPQDKLWSLTRKGYIIDRHLFSSAFADFIRQQVIKPPLLSPDRGDKPSTKVEEFTPRWRPVAALVSLLLALGSGILATIFSDPRWLLGTVVLAILAVVFIAIPATPKQGGLV
jgi:hypothetical protein